MTKGLQESIREFRKLDEEIELESLLERLAKHPPWASSSVRPGLT